MILETNKPIGHEDLDLATELAQNILQYIIDNPGPLNESTFKAHFNTIGDWLLNGPEDVRQGIKSLFELGKEDRAILLDVFKNDTSFYKYFNKGEFQFQFKQIGVPLQKALKKMMVPFYESLLGGSGFKHLSGLNNNPFKRKHFLEGYLQANNNTRICPVCLGHMNGYNSDLREDTEHYFPKESYPALAVSSYNLIPICQFCNRNSHGSKDPIENHKNLNSLLEIYLPYHRGAFNDIKVQFNNPGERIVSLSAKSESEPYTFRIQNLIRLYKLDEKWTFDMPTIHDKLINRLSQKLVMTGCSKENLITALRNEMVLLSSELKTQPESYLSFCYLRWIYKEKAIFDIIYTILLERHEGDRQRYEEDFDVDII